MKPQADLAVIGLAVMGENLILNLESKGFTVACYNRTTAKVDAFLAGRAQHKNILGRHDPAELVSLLARPRVLLLMVRAGFAVDELIDELSPLLEPGDILVDGGNAHFPDTRRREADLRAKGLHFVGAGISGGEEGALKGPSIMPGGPVESYAALGPMLESIAAQVDGVPCCTHVGPDGAGHFVKMVHNGIEYGDMQMIAEIYHFMRDGLGLDNRAMHTVFSGWNRGVLDSYLIEITRDILGYRDERGEATLDHILDAAGQKGTGKWTAFAALDAGQPLTLIAEAVFARCLSSLKDERVAASGVLKGPNTRFRGDRKAILGDLRDALYASKIVSYAQGYQLMRAAAQEYGWSLNYGGIALMWRGGCIIRSAFLGKIKEAYDRNPGLVNLLLDPFFKRAVTRAQEGWRRVVSSAVRMGIPMPAIGAALAYYDGYRTDALPANLLQAQRDYFGAHTYERTDRPRGEFFHTNWTGRGGHTAASTYVV